MVRRMLSRRPSAAGLIAVLALVLATAGTATAAGLITSKQIKNNTVKSKDVRNGTLKAVDVKADALGGGQIDEASLAKVPSAAAADTATNATQLGGLAAGAYVRNVEYVASSPTIGSVTKQAFATCPAGKKVIGGTAAVGGTDEAYLQRSTMAVEGTQWFAQARSVTPGNDNYTLDAIAICANVG